ncbi:hypothetical protein BpHYR1_029779 [Brachionus plicatilis]|uniref:Uncharacterized protein n=1 Tax=Brachionus plicatilis TaxID=10195 RepID=A0A3M7PBB6_BRAPC|nr:hypothetical protein BpHYR1_029779 [Brachionus plicatilis]
MGITMIFINQINTLLKFLTIEHTQIFSKPNSNCNESTPSYVQFPRPSLGHVMFQPSPTQVTLKEETPKKTHQSTKTRNKASAAPKRSRGRPRKNRRTKSLITDFSYFSAFKFTKYISLHFN